MWREVTVKLIHKLTKNDKKQPRSSGCLSLNDEMISAILKHAKPFGHYEDEDTLNLGFGFLYYSLARILRPDHILIIGSGYGFSVVCFALGLKDNGKGFLSFVDPSYSVLKQGPFKTIGGRNYWSDSDKVKNHFEFFGVGSFIKHYKMRSDEFFSQFEKLNLPPLDITFIDGSHTFKDVKSDFCNSVSYSSKNSYILLHDTYIYVRELIGHAGVKKLLNKIRSQTKYFELVDYPFSSGVAIVRVRKVPSQEQMEKWFG